MCGVTGQHVGLWPRRWRFDSAPPDLLSPSVMATFLALNQAILGSNPRATTMCISSRTSCCLHKIGERVSYDGWNIITYICCWCDTESETRYRGTVWTFVEADHGPHLPSKRIMYGGCVNKGL